MLLGKRAAHAAGLAALLTLIAAGAAQAAYPDSYVTVEGYYTDPDAARNADFGMGFALGMGFRVGDTTSLEVRGFSNTFETGPAGPRDYFQLGLGLDLLQAYGDEARGHLYSRLGGGVVDNDVVPNSRDETNIYGNVAFGYRGTPLQNWNLRPRFELRGVYDAFDGGQQEFVAALGFDILPRQDRVVEKVVEKIVEKIVEVPVEKIVEKEVLKEVVLDVDSDGDGVVDARDKCPNTLAGAKVDGDGCVRAEQTITLPNIEFESGKSALTARGEGTLEAVVRFLDSQPDVGLEIIGHTDSQGADAYNLKLSEGRARSVLQYLVAKGASAARLSSKGMGESQPIASNETKEGRAQNRRVELRIRAKAP